MMMITTEITQREALQSLLRNEELSDMTLHGSDGVLVFANRGLLASRSPVFYRMLFGQFEEASKTDIELGYDGAVLEAIVEYIYTDDVSTLNFDNDEDEDDDDETPSCWDMTFVQFLVNLVDAANYFALPKLCQKIEKATNIQMKKNHNVAALFLAVCNAPPDSNDETKVLQVLALNYVKKYPTIIIDGKKEIIAMIHPLFLESILKDETLIMDEHSCFRMLQSWANAAAEEEKGGEDDDNNHDHHKDELQTADDEPSCNDQQPNSSIRRRKRIAAKMTNYIHLEDIDVMELSTMVSDSGLVTTEQLTEAYKKQSIRASKKRCTDHKSRRGGNVWNSSRTTIFENNDAADTVNCPIMKSGVHKWRIKVLEHDDYLECGVVSTRWPIPTDGTLSRYQGGWGYGTDGEVAHAYLAPINSSIRTGLPTYSEGSTISFTLNLRAGEGGTLTASIDGNGGTNPFELFTGMLEGYVYDDENDDNGFLPAVSAEGGGRVEFLGFEQAA